LNFANNDLLLQVTVSYHLWVKSNKQLTQQPCRGPHCLTCVELFLITK